MKKRRLFPVEKSREASILNAKEEHPREFKDYKISWHVDGCKEPEEFDFV